MGYGYVDIMIFKGCINVTQNNGTSRDNVGIIRDDRSIIGSGFYITPSLRHGGCRIFGCV